MWNGLHIVVLALAAGDAAQVGERALDVEKVEVRVYGPQSERVTLKALFDEDADDGVVEIDADVQTEHRRRNQRVLYHGSDITKALDKRPSTSDFGDSSDSSDSEEYDDRAWHAGMFGFTPGLRHREFAIVHEASRAKQSRVERETQLERLVGAKQELIRQSRAEVTALTGTVGLLRDQHTEELDLRKRVLRRQFNDEVATLTKQTNRRAAKAQRQAPPSWKHAETECEQVEGQYCVPPRSRWGSKGDPDGARCPPEDEYQYWTEVEGSHSKHCNTGYGVFASKHTCCKRTLLVQEEHDLAVLALEKNTQKATARAERRAQRGFAADAGDKLDEIARLQEDWKWTLDESDDQIKEVEAELQKGKDASAEALTEVYLRTSNMCGVGLFSQPELTCEPVPAEDAVRAFKSLRADGAFVDRGIGVEIEMVSRTPTDEFIKETRGDAAYWVEQHAPLSIDVTAAMRENRRQGGMAYLHEHLNLRIKREIEDRLEGNEVRAGIARTANASSSTRRQVRRFPRFLADVQGGLGAAGTTILEAYDKVLRKLPGVRACFDKSQAKGDERGEASSCATHTDCALHDFCVGGLRADRHTCRPRTACKPRDSVDGLCPVPLSRWAWETDCTVETLTRSEVKQAWIGKAAGSQFEAEMDGVGFELVSPPPPHALTGETGVRSVVETLSILHAQGVQAGPTQGLHVHVNVGKPGKPKTAGDGAGDSLSQSEIANVWAQYAKYQIIIDEMLQDSRIGNEWAAGLRFHDYAILEPGSSSPSWRWSRPVVRPGQTFNADVFTRMHHWVKGADGTRDYRPTDFCDYVVTGYRPNARGQSASKQCTPAGYTGSWYPEQRYSHINLVILNLYGTIEFRAFPASHDAERVSAWVQFVTNFVERMRHRSELFRRSSAADAIAELEKKQVLASLAELEDDLDMDLSIFRERKWEQVERGGKVVDNPACVDATCDRECQLAQEEQLQRTQVLIQQAALLGELAPSLVLSDANTVLDATNFLNETPDVGSLLEQEVGAGGVRRERAAAPAAAAPSRKAIRLPTGASPEAEDYGALRALHDA